MKISTNKNSGNILIIILLLVFVVVGGVLAVSVFRNQSSQKNGEQKFSEKITIGYAPWPGYIGLFIARDKGFFEEEGLNIEIKGYPSLAALSEDYRAGKIQGRANLNLDSINEAIEGLDHKAILVIDYSNGSDGIIARHGITGLSQAKGKRIAYEFGTLEEFFLTYALQRSNLNLNDIQGVDLNPEASANAFIKGDVDMAVTYEPFMSDALGKAEGNKIFSSADAPAGSLSERISSTVHGDLGYK